MPSNNQRNNELDFTPTFGTLQVFSVHALKRMSVKVLYLNCSVYKTLNGFERLLDCLY